MFNRPPYTWDPGTVNPAVLELLERGVETRVLYQAAQWAEPSAEVFRSSHAAYHRAGVQARLVEALPIKMAIADRRVALIGMRGPLEAIEERTFPTNLLIEDPGMAEVMAASFEHLWDAGEAV